LIPMATDGVGPSYTGVKLLQGAQGAGYPVDLFVNRYRMPDAGLTLHVALPGPLGLLPYPWLSALASRRLEARYAASIREGEIAYLWPSASLALHEVLNRRGIPILLEGINTRMAHAKRLLDAAYDAFSAPPAHGITEARIAEEEAKLALATAIFAPSRPVAEALAGSPLQDRTIVASYGVDTARPIARPPRDPDAPLTFMFCGYASVRKGAHHLLDAWRSMPQGVRLLIVGRIEPVIAERYRDVLSSGNVEAVGFVQDVHAQFARSDAFILPSLEEGDPLVTYEAALHGLPIIASPMGGGRMGDVPGRMILVDLVGPEPLAQAMRALAGSAELRADLGRTVRRAVDDYDWSQVAARRFAALDGVV
jgi:glycosyltransferase involved in cell wall biosynthesis